MLNEEALKLVHLTPGNLLFPGMLGHIREAWSLMETYPASVMIPTDLNPDFIMVETLSRSDPPSQIV